MSRSSNSYPYIEREKDRVRYPDKVFNAWLDESTDDNEGIVWDEIKCIESAWRAWQQAWGIYGSQ